MDQVSFSSRVKISAFLVRKRFLSSWVFRMVLFGLKYPYFRYVSFKLVDLFYFAGINHHGLHSLFLQDFKVCFSLSFIHCNT